jgi:hypothetical protein
MPESLVPESMTDVEFKRDQLLEQFLCLGDFRPGSIYRERAPCGNPTC